MEAGQRKWGLVRGNGGQSEGMTKYLQHTGNDEVLTAHWSEGMTKYLQHTGNDVVLTAHWE